MKQFKNLDFRTFFNSLQNESKAILIDVRSSREYSLDHAKNAINFDVLKPDQKKKLFQMSPEHSFYLYCSSGGRSAVIAQEMVNQGFEKVYNLKDGIH